MMKTVYCQKLKKTLTALEKPPYPGELGQKIFKNISKQAWNDWLAHQTRLINERRLNLLDLKAREMLAKEMENFLFNTGSTTNIEGYVPEEK